MLKERLHRVLLDQAQTGNPTTYKELADRLGLEPPQTVHRVVEALETLMMKTSLPVALCWLHCA
jgi:DNA-binding Lrp family transcriptional regulator